MAAKTNYSLLAKIRAPLRAGFCYIERLEVIQIIEFAFMLWVAYMLWAIAQIISSQLEILNKNFTGFLKKKYGDNYWLPEHLGGSPKGKARKEVNG